MARAMGEVIEILPSFTFASSSPTILIDGFCIRIFVDDCHGCAELDGITIQLGDINHLRARQLVLDLGQPAFNPALPVLGSMIFGIFRKIAMLTRLRNRLNHRRAFSRFQVLHFFVEGFETVGGHRNF